MKNYKLFFIAIASIFSLNCFAQVNNDAMGNAKIGNTQLMADSMSDYELTVVSYHVEERKNMPFGSSITTYDVSNLSLVSTTDLGKNNTRVVTPKYAKVKSKPLAALNEQPVASVGAPLIAAETLKMNIAAPTPSAKTVKIDILSTYERVIDKGYQSVDMLKRVGNSRFFDNDLTMAAKWYSQLFTLTTDLEAIYFYRYAQSLKFIGQLEKSNQMMAAFEKKNL